MMEMLETATILHNATDRSLIILDEIQTIPYIYWGTIKDILKNLGNILNLKVILMTATKPLIFNEGEYNELVDNYQDYFKTEELNRVTIKPDNSKTVDELVNNVVDNLTHNSYLFVFNTINSSLEFYNKLKSKQGYKIFYLSTNIIPKERKKRIEKIKTLIKKNKKKDKKNKFIVITTQLIEAGVDVDFPCVYRAVAGIDSIAQAAGRCNRNGKSKVPLRVNIFNFPDGIGCSYFRHAAQSAERLFVPFAGRLTDPQCVQEYFNNYYWINNQRMDADGIVISCQASQTGDIQFKDLAKFKMIESATVPIIIALEEEAKKLVDALNFAEHKGGILRKLQQYTVQVYPYQFYELQSWCENPMDGVWVLDTDELYSEDTGLQCNPPEGTAFFG